MTSEKLSDSILHSSYRTAELPEDERFDAWSESISRMFRPYLAPGVKPKDHSVSVDFFMLGETVLGGATMSGVGGCHNPGSSPTRDVAEIFVVEYVRRGGYIGYNGAQEIKATAGDIVILEPARGLSLRTEVNLEVVNFLVPRRMLLEAIGNRGSVYPRLLSKRSLSGEILRYALDSTWRGLSDRTRADAEEVSGLLLGAVAGVMRGADTNPERTAVDYATFGTICAYIERNLKNPELSPDHLCKQFFCSRARLYRLFEPVGGIANYIRRARLERCRAALASMRRKVNVSEIALEWGFGNISHFNRLFRETYGSSPSEVRGAAALHIDGSSMPSNLLCLPAPEYKYWLERL